MMQYHNNTHKVNKTSPTASEIKAGTILFIMIIKMIIR